MPEVKARPIAFTGEMISAFPFKSLTRRRIKKQPEGELLELLKASVGNFIHGEDGFLYVTDKQWRPAKTDYRSRYGKPGDRLWVKEAWCHKSDEKDQPLCNEAGNYDSSCVHYRADGQEVLALDDDGFTKWNKDGTLASPWHSPRFMPRWASRFTLEVENICLEQVQDIGEIDAILEGCPVEHIEDPCAWYEKLFRSIYSDTVWDANEWVEVIKFRQVKE
jgi:hypothetical protein